MDVMSNVAVRRDAVAASPSNALLADTVSACIAAISERLAAKGPMYEPDAEWTALRACAVALEDAARLLTANIPGGKRETLTGQADRFAYRIIGRWLEWARMHGHLEHAEGIVRDSREIISNVGNPAARWRGQPHTTPSTGREEPLYRGLIATSRGGHHGND